MYIAANRVLDASQEDVLVAKDLKVVGAERTFSHLVSLLVTSSVTALQQTGMSQAWRYCGGKPSSSRCRIDVQHAIPPVWVNPSLLATRKSSNNGLCGRALGGCVPSRSAFTRTTRSEQRAQVHRCTQLDGLDEPTGWVALS